MSAVRDSLAPGQRAAYEQAIDAAATILARGRDERDRLAATGGPEAVAEAAYVPGGPPKEEIAAVYRQLQAETRAARAERPDTAA
jgi:hypothetical protein